MSQSMASLPPPAFTHPSHIIKHYLTSPKENLSILCHTSPEAKRHDALYKICELKVQTSASSHHLNSIRKTSVFKLGPTLLVSTITLTPTKILITPDLFISTSLPFKKGEVTNNGTNYKIYYGRKMYVFENNLKKSFIEGQQNAIFTRLKMIHCSLFRMISFEVLSTVKNIKLASS